MDTAEPIRAAWKGSPTDPTEHHYGIPARDLTQEDYLALDTAQRQTVRHSPLYSYVMAKDLPGRQHDTEDDEPEVTSTQPDDTPTETPEDFAAVAAEEGMTSDGQ